MLNGERTGEGGISDGLLAIQYRPGEEEDPGWTSVRGVGSLLLRILLAVVISAGVTFIWLPLGFSKIFLLACMGQGISLGIGLRKGFRAARLRKSSIALPVSIAASVLAVALVYVEMYVREVILVFLELRPQTAGHFDLRAFFQSHPFRMFDLLVLIPSVRQPGILGYFLYRFVRHPFLLNATFFHVLLTAFICWQIARAQLRVAFCKSCGKWLQPKNAAVLPSSFFNPLIAAVKSNDVAQALALTRSGANLPLGSGCAVARLHHCLSCDERSVDVILKVFGGRTTNSVGLKPTVVSREFVDALRSEPVLSEPGQKGEAKADSAI